MNNTRKTRTSVSVILVSWDHTVYIMRVVSRSLNTLHPADNICRCEVLLNDIDRKLAGGFSVFGNKQRFVEDLINNSNRQPY